MNKEKMPMVLMGFSVLAALVAGYVFLMGQDVFTLAGTQWILIAIVLGVYANFAVNCPCCQGDSCCAKPEESKM